MKTPPVGLGMWLRAMDFISHHPSNQGHGIRWVARYVGWQLWKRLARRPRLVELINGIRVKAYPDSRGAGLVIYTGLPEYDDMLFAFRYLRHDEGFVDVGANIGVYTLLAASKAPNGIVLAFEPNPTAATRLIENIKLNGFTNVVVREVAVGAFKGSVRVTSTLDVQNRVAMASDGGPTLDVALTTLDMETSDQKKIALVKLDTEGFESEVLKGAARLLDQNPAPVWIVEVNGLGQRYGGGDAAILDAFQRHGYRPFKYDATLNRLQPRSETDLRSEWNLIFIRDKADVVDRLAASHAL